MRTSQATGRRRLIFESFVPAHFPPIAILILLLISIPVSASEKRNISSLFPLEVAWELDLESPPSAPPTSDNTQVYVPLRSGNLRSVTLDTGHIQWSVKLSSTWTPTTGDNAVYVSTASAIHALRKENGQEIWRAKFKNKFSAAPLWNKSWLFVGLEDGNLVSLQAKDGVEVWRQPLESPLAQPPSMKGSRLYAPLKDGRIVALDLLSGNVIWQRTLPGGTTEILALQDRLFVGSTDNYLYSLSSQDGNIKWRWRTGADVIGPPVVGGPHVYFLSLDNVLRGLDRNVGNQRWKQPLLLRPTSGPLLIDEILLVSGRNQEINAYYSRDGTSLGSFIASEELASPPLIYEEATGKKSLAIITGEGKLQLLRRGMDPKLVPLTYMPGTAEPPPLQPLNVLPGTELPPLPLPQKLSTSSFYTSTDTSVIEMPRKRAKCSNLPVNMPRLHFS